MGLSISASAAILFVAFVVCFASLFGAVSDYQEAAEAAAGMERARLLDTASTSLAFENVDARNGSFVLGNRGQTVLDISDLEVLVDGRLIPRSEVSMSVQGHDGSRLAFCGDRVSVQTGIDLEGCRVMIVTHTGSSTTYVPA